MKSPVLLRTASILALIHAVLHTAGGLFSAPAHGPAEVAILDAMKSTAFDFMGSDRSYWDFYMGFGLFLTVALVMQAVLLWQLAGLAKLDPDRARPLIATLFVAFAAGVVLSWRYFFIAPLVMEIIIAALTGLAYVLARPRRPI
jgi:hypothetical protein